MNDLSPIGHNNPPDPIDEAAAPFDAILSEAQNWADGEPVTNEAQMKAVDSLIKEVKRAAKEVGAARDASTKPLHEAWKAEIARWKPTLDDLDRIVKCLVAAVDPFKRELAAKKEAAERAAWEAANKARREAEAAAAKANAADVEAQRAVEDARIKAMVAEREAQDAARDTVKGMRPYTEYVVLDGTAFARWIWQNDRPALAAFMDDYAKRHRCNIPGVVEARTERRAF